jgi:hypothetical protein
MTLFAANYTNNNTNDETIESAKHQQTVVLVMTCVGTLIILPFGLWSLYISLKAKVRTI